MAGGRDSRIAMVRLGVDDRQYLQKLNGAERAAKTFGDRVKANIKSGIQKNLSRAGDIVAVGAIAGFAMVAREALKTDERLTRLAISAGKSRGQILQLNEQMNRTAAASGVSQDQLLAGAEKYQALTGRLDEYTGALGTFAQVSAATGANMDDLATAAAALSDNLAVSPKEMERVFDVLTQQGKDGAVELKDLAGELAGVTGQFRLFGTVGPKGVAELGAWFQVLRKGAPSAAEASTQLEALMGAIRLKHEDLSGAGVNVWADSAKTQLKDLSVIADDILAKVPQKDWASMFGRKEAQNALITYKLHRAELKQLENEQGKLGTTAKDAAVWQASSAGQIAKASASLKAAFSEALVKNIDSIVAAIKAMTHALEWLVKHPEAFAGFMLLSKGGAIGNLGGLAGAAGAMGGGGGGGGGMSFGAGGWSRGASAAGAGGWQSGLQSAGRAVQGAGVGLMLGELAGANNNASRAAYGLAGALLPLAGPLGALGLAASLAAVAISDHLTASIDKREQAIASDPWAGSTERDRRVLGGGGFNPASYFKVKAGDEMGAGGVKMDIAGFVDALLREGHRTAGDASATLQQGREQGVVTDVNGLPQLDEKKLKRSLSGSTLSPEDQQRKVAAMREAVDLAIQSEFARRMNGGTGAPAFEAPAGPKPFYEMGSGGPGIVANVIGGIGRTLGGLDVPTGGGPTRPKQVIDVVLNIKAAPGSKFDIEQDPKQRKGR